MLKIAITGGIASGKSFIINELAKLKKPVISADEEISKIYQNPSIIKKLTQEFGVSSKNEIKKIVTSDSIKLRKLEKILYFSLHKAFLEFERKSRKRGYKECFFEVPLVFEKNMSHKYDKIINIETPIFLQKRRFLKRLGASNALFYQFKNLQFHNMKKSSLSNLTIKNFYSKNLLRQKLLCL
jgi:dephospho-CoA kinase